MKFPLITALAAFHNFLKVVFSYSLSSKYFLIYIFSLPGDHLEVYWQLGGHLSVTELWFNFTVVGTPTQ